MRPLFLLALLAAAPTAFAQTLTTVWDTTFAGASAVGVSQDGATVAIGRSSVPFERSAAITLHDAATGARTGALPTPGGAGFRTPSVLAFDADGASVYTAGRTSTCGANTCTSYADIVRIDVDSGAERFETRIDTRLATVRTSGDYLTYTRRLSSNDTDFAVFEDGPDSLALVFAGEDEFGNPVSLGNTFSPDGTRLVAIRANRGDYFVDIRRVGTWDVERTIPVPRISYDQPISAVLSPDNALLAVAVVPTAGNNPGGLYLFRVSDGQQLVYRPFAADSPNEIRFSGYLRFMADGEHIAGVESGFTDQFRTEWVSVFRASDGVRVASMRIGAPHEYNDRGPLGIEAVPGATPQASRFAVVAYNYAAVVEARPGANPVATEAEPSDDALTLTVAPNPAVGITTLRLSARETQTVRADLFDALGRRVALLFDGSLQAGHDQAVQIDAGMHPPGVYVVRVMGEAGPVSRRVLFGR